MSEVWKLAADVVEQWRRRRRAPRDAMAEHRLLHAQPAAVRARVARLAQAVVAASRRLEFVWQAAGGPWDLAPEVQAMVLVLAYEVEQGTRPAATAERACAVASGRQFDFATLLQGESYVAAIANGDQRFAVRHSMPDWFATRLCRQYGAEAEPVAAALAQAPPRTLRTNTLRLGSREELRAALAAAGVVSRATDWAPFGLQVDGDSDLFATPLFRSGAFEQQDEASQLAALLVAPPPGGRVLDLCAGSGGKTLALAAAMQNRGEILATDVHAGRLESLRERARRAGVSNLRVVAIGEHGLGDVAAAFAGRADRILIDAPCSGVGSWRRRPEARWSLEPAQLEALVAVQDRLLERAAHCLRPGARLVYATCSLLEQENEARVAAVQARWPQLELVRIAEILGRDAARPVADATGTFLSLRPDRHGCDGFFAAVLRRRRAD